MGCSLHTADLSDEAKRFLSELGSRGDEAEAARQKGTSQAEIQRWARLPEYQEHRREAPEYFRSWKDPGAAVTADPSRWPLEGRR